MIKCDKGIFGCFLLQIFTTFFYCKLLSIDYQNKDQT